MTTTNDSRTPEGLGKGGSYIRDEKGNDTLQERTAPGPADTRPVVKKAPAPKVTAKPAKAAKEA